MSNESPAAYAKEEARKIFQAAVKDQSVIFPQYARKRMKERKLDTNDVLNLAHSGICANEPEKHIKTGNWTYRIESLVLGIRSVFTIENIENKKKVRIVTVFDKNDN